MRVDKFNNFFNSYSGVKNALFQISKVNKSSRILSESVEDKKIVN